MHDDHSYVTPCERTGSALYRVITVTALGILLFLSGSMILVSTTTPTPARGAHLVQEQQISHPVSEPHLLPGNCLRPLISSRAPSACDRSSFALPMGPTTPLYW